MRKLSAKEILLQTLVKHPDGLSIKELARKSGLHRHTASKYVLALKEAGLIKQKEIGRATVCILSKGVKNV